MDFIVVHNMFNPKPMADIFRQPSMARVGVRVRVRDRV